MIPFLPKNNQGYLTSHRIPKQGAFVIFAIDPSNILSKALVVDMEQKIIFRNISPSESIEYYGQYPASFITSYFKSPKIS
jgi:hypothetical protein